jgi:hypothetical protein
MPYSTGRVVHDADAHIMEPPTWLRDHADPAIRERIEPLRYPGGNELRQTGSVEDQQRDLVGAFDRLAGVHRSDAYRSDAVAAGSRSGEPRREVDVVLGDSVARRSGHAHAGT